MAECRNRVIFARSAAPTADGSLSPNSFRARRMLLTAESDQEETWSAIVQLFVFCFTDLGHADAFRERFSDERIDLRR